jgi:hypothetical protein
MLLCVLSDIQSLKTKKLGWEKQIFTISFGISKFPATIIDYIAVYGLCYNYEERDSMVVIRNSTTNLISD